MITILLAGNSDLYLEVLADRLKFEDDIHVIGRARNTEDIINNLTLHNPDVLFLDTSLFELNFRIISDTIQKDNKKTKILLLMNIEDDETIIQALSSGIKGCLEHDSGYGSFIEAVRTIMEDRIWADTRILSQLLKKFLGNLNNRDSVKNDLTQRELQVSDLVVKGLSNKAIARDLAISEKTVKAHIGHIFRKLGIKHRYQLSPNIVNKLAILRGIKTKS